MIVHDDARLNMVEGQLRPNKVTDERVIDAFLRLGRELFVPAALGARAYIDDDLPLGGGRYLMQPMVAARLLQAAVVQPNDSALVVGAGVGYEAAVLALLGARGVLALEPDAGLARLGRSALVDHGIATVSYVEAPMTAAPPPPAQLGSGNRARSPYDVILFAGAVTAVPSEISAQLAEGGRMVVVLRPQQPVGRYPDHAHWRNVRAAHYI